MDYKTLNDNELVYLCSENNEEATSLLIDKYRNCILKILKEYLKEYSIRGMEVADLYQEGLIGLIHAIKTFDPKKDITFYTYSNACIKNSIISAMRQSFRKKNNILNNSYSLDNLIEDTNSTFYELFKDEASDPSTLLLDKEETDDIISRIRAKLSEGENEIFELRLKGLSNSEISILLDKDKKNIENTMYRINKKYKELLK